MGTALRVGVTVPTFVDHAEAAMVAAQAAEAGGLDGVFAFDHLWPMGSPGRPAMWSFATLAAVGATTERVTVGPLVARVGLLSEDDLVGAFRALVAIAGRSRVIAAIGAGDRLSAAENRAYGVAYPPAAARLAEVGVMVDRIHGLGLEAWVGGNSDAAGRVAQDHGAVRNVWGLTAEELEGLGGRDGHVPPVTWGGQVLVGRDSAEITDLRARYGDRPGLVSGTVGEFAARLVGLREAGARWCVCAPLDYLDAPQRSVETLSLAARSVQ